MARIVIVDDDPTLAEVIAESLQFAGHETTICTDHGQVHVAIARDRPDVVLLDIRVHGAPRGLALLESWQDDPRTATTPVIVCTADSAFVRDRGAWLRERGIPVLEKPFEFETLVEMVQRELEG